MYCIQFSIETKTNPFFFLLRISEEKCQTMESPENLKLMTFFDWGKLLGVFPLFLNMQFMKIITIFHISHFPFCIKNMNF